MTTTRIAINGAAGRMGQRLIALGSQDESLEIVAALEYAQHPELGRDAGELAGVGKIGVPLAAELGESPQVVIDFSVPQGAEKITACCVRHEIPLVMATTGLSDAQRTAVETAAHEIPVVWAPNMSLAVNLTFKLAEYAARALKDYPRGADVEIIDRHHRFKEDAPSGTALFFGKVIAEAMGQTSHVHGRHGQIGKRAQSEIGYHALRVGDNPGEHQIVFGLLGETVELSVKATTRDCYASGALAAAQFLADQGPGLYNMYDVLGL